MIDWKFWKAVSYGVMGTIAAILPILGLIKGIAELKNILSNHAKPQLLDVQNCSIRVSTNAETIKFELLVNNSGSKDCSITSIELTWPDGLNANLEWGAGSSTPLPKTIPAGITERITVEGLAYKFIDSFTPEKRMELQPFSPFAEAAVAIKFNTKHIVIKKITFTTINRL